MIFERFVEEGLSQFSYVMADETTREAAVVDPLRDVDRYVDWIDARDLELTGVLETHIHADYCSGSLELAELAEVPYYTSALDTGEKFEMRFDHQALSDGDTVDVGDMTVEAVHTPGHTPEHLSYLVYEGDVPVKLFSGDFLFVRSLGRPDLIGEEEKRPLALNLYQSVQMVKKQNWPADLAIHPAHGAGSLCGAGLSEQPESTLGEEKNENPYFQIEDEDEFVDTVLDALGDFPPYYTRMKQTNSHGAPFLQPIDAPGDVEVGEFVDRYESDQDVTVIDLRDQTAFGRSHVPGALNLAHSPRINRYGPWVIPYDRPIYLVGDVSMTEEDMEQAYRYLVRVELDRVDGYLKGGYQAWQSEGHPSRETTQYDAQLLHEAIQNGDQPLVVDVRTEDEYGEGHVPGSRWIPFGRLRDRTDELPDEWDHPIVTICSSGYRSSLAASLLENMGYDRVGHLNGGFSNWTDENFNVEHELDADKSAAASTGA